LPAAIPVHSTKVKINFAYIREVHCKKIIYFAESFWFSGVYLSHLRISMCEPGHLTIRSRLRFNLAAQLGAGLRA
jgi:hypothetical protein